MSTVTHPGPPQDRPPGEDPFRYGWRYRNVVGQAGMEWYVIIDALGFRNGQRDLRVIGYRAGPSGYLSVPLDERGWLWVGPLEIYVAVRAGRVVCYDKAGTELLDHLGEHQARQA